MTRITVIKSPKPDCKTCHEAQRVVEEAARAFPGKVSVEVLFSNTPEADEYGIISTPVVAINRKIYSMGKPVILEKVDSWIKRET